MVTLITSASRLLPMNGACNLPLLFVDSTAVAGSDYVLFINELHIHN